ncbi:hypothetical protein [Yersinia pseudotuberculosis]|uniref:hypothetical protein n=1 Tax=Yersinia pseudotuberculosis TaxID=633 RepID=UPI0005EA3F2E|nr:hemolysin [Yersinia pseudotuberculosis]
MKKHTFKLSPAGKLAAAVTIISVSVATCYAAGIVGAGDSAHKPDVSSVNGTSVINSVQTISYTKDGNTVKISESDEKKETKDKWWQKGAKSVGKKIKSAVQDEQVVGGNGSLKANVEVVESQGVEEQSAIRGTQNVDLTVKGKTELVGGKISSKNSDVKLKTNGLETQDINGKYTEGGARLNASSSVMDMISDGAKDVMDGKAPLVSGHGKSEQKNATGGITRE